MEVSESIIGVYKYIHPPEKDIHIQSVYIYIRCIYIYSYHRYTYLLSAPAHAADRESSLTSLATVDC